VASSGTGAGDGGGRAPSGPDGDEAGRLLAPFLEQPDRAGVLTDFDGTLSAIVPDPAAARPLPGVADALHQLAGRFGRVAVISGRPAAFLAEHLGGGGDALVLSGLYGLERVEGDRVVEDPEAAQWRPAIDEAAEGAEGEAPPGLFVERKGLSVTLHWRRAPEHEAWAKEWAAATAERTGLAVHGGRASAELRPPLSRDKGTMVEELGAGLEAVCFMGDDTGDLPAFAALQRLPAAHTVAVAVTSEEAPPELTEAADLVVEGPDGALALLRRLL
jgi:trehalose 6-phosphate phosphatase